MDFTVRSIATVHNSRKEASDDFWGDVVSEIILDDDIPAEAFDGIDTFSHAEIIFLFHHSLDTYPVMGSAHPRGNESWPRVGIFAQRKSNRPNHLGATVCEIVKRNGRILTVRLLDAIDGTPVVDIKPVMKEFLPATAVVQPSWSGELMGNYWK
jgi:tRNA-Thr(GGU) m(6)t(6)A37 methyltransferase TsaA